MTHYRINLRIAQSPIQEFSLDDYLREQLDVQEGIRKVLKGEEWMWGWASREIFKWIQMGGLYEDRPPWGISWLRSFNHFHNPLTNKGFAYAPCTSSAKDWAFMSIGTQILDGNFSWFDARDYFYKSLTLAKKEEREKYFAAMFRSLGQVMHLVQDVSVPEHTRDDAHVLRGYEDWVNTYGNINTVPVFFEELLQMAGTTLPLVYLFDSDRYDGTNPDITIGAVGLAEYTNANFVSADTRDSFSYPKIENCNVVARPYAGPTGTHDREYFLKNGYGETNEGRGYLLCVRDYNDYWRNLTIGDMPSFRPKYSLDENVYKEYSELLLPRAVGYSAALLKYFFRGQLDVEVIQGEGIRITNMSEEDMDGEFKIYYDSSDGSRKQVIGASWSFALRAGMASSTLTFEVPSDISELKTLTLVFKGRLGYEKEAVVGKVFFSGQLYWTVVIRHSGGAFSIGCGEVPGTWTDCGTSVGAIWHCTVYTNCSPEDKFNVYLIGSEWGFQDATQRGTRCEGYLKIKAIGKFTGTPPSVNYQIINRDTYRRQIVDSFGSYACLLGGGTMAYTIADYWAYNETGLYDLSWIKSSVDEPEIQDILGRLTREDYRVHAALKASVFANAAYGEYAELNFFSDDFSYPESSYPPMFVASDDSYSTVCYCWHEACYPDEYPLCMTVVGWIPSDRPFATSKNVRLSIPSLGIDLGSYWGF